MPGELLDHSEESQLSEDPTRGLRRLVALLVLLALAAAGGAFAVSQRGSSGPAKHQLPALFPARFSQTGFLDREATLVSSYDATSNARQTTGSIRVTGAVYVVARCSAGSIRVAIGALKSTQACTGAPIGVVALQLTRPVEVAATVTAPQTSRWGFAIYQ